MYSIFLGKYVGFLSKTSKTKSPQICKSSQDWTQSSLDLLSCSSLHFIEKKERLQLISFSELRMRNILKASVICAHSLGCSFIISLQPVEDKLNNVGLQLFKVYFCFFYVLGVSFFLQYTTAIFKNTS